jgi:hypothetical protein
VTSEIKVKCTEDQKSSSTALINKSGRRHVLDGSQKCSCHSSSEIRLKKSMTDKVCCLSVCAMIFTQVDTDPMHSFPSGREGSRSICPSHYSNQHIDLKCRLQENRNRKSKSNYQNSTAKIKNCIF